MFELKREKERTRARERSKDVDEAESDFKTAGKFQMNANIQNMMRCAMQKGFSFLFIFHCDTLYQQLFV